LSDSEVSVVYTHPRDTADSDTYSTSLHNWNSVLNPKVSYSDDGFYGYDYGGNMYQCDQMSSSSTSSSLLCDGTRTIKSADDLDYSYLSSVGKSVIVWANHSRRWTNIVHPVTGVLTEVNDIDEVRVSVGAISPTRLSASDSLGIYSSVPPAVACNNNSLAGSADCVVLFVDSRDTTFLVEAQRFEVSWSSTMRRYVATPVGTPSPIRSGARTGARITAFYHSGDGRFWVAYKSMNQGQPVIVLRDADGTGNWSWVSSIEHSVTGPSSVGAFTGNNVIVTVD